MKIGLALLCALSAIALTYAQDAPPGCDRPLWHGTMQDNWPLPGPKTRKKTVFRMNIKGIGSDSTFTPGKTYNVAISALRPKRQPRRISGFLLLAQAEETDGCDDASAGVFKVGRKGTGTAKAGCNDVTYNETPALSKTRAIKWVAPSCGCVTISVEINSSDNLIFYDTLDDGVDPKYKLLAKKICAAPKTQTTEA